MSNKPLARRDNIVVQELPAELLIYDLNMNKAFCLNETSRLIWNHCDGKNSAAEISRLVSTKLKKTVDEDLVRLALDQLCSQDLLENGGGAVPVFKAMSRRELIRKVGNSAVVTLPVVVALIAPTSAEARSCGPITGPNLPNGCTCQNNGSCASNNCTGAPTKTCQP